jgi:hypothetical protein
MNRHSKRLAWMAGAGVILGGLAGSAWAQDGFDKPLTTGKDKGSDGATSTNSSSSLTLIRQDDGDNAYELRIQGDQVTAKVNGKEIPAERIQRDKNEVRILDENGKVVATFQVSMGGSEGHGTSVGGRHSNRMRSLSMPAQPSQPTQPSLPATPQPEPPKVMIGINMGPASADQLKEGGLKEDSEAIVIERVIPDLPAEKAGLREGDLITEIDGQPATEDKLREVMKGKKPGDTVKLTVRRDGADKTIRIQVAKYDSKLLPMTMPTPQPDWSGSWSNDDIKKFLEKNNGMTLVTPGGPGGQPQFFSSGGNVDAKMAELDKKLSDLDDRLNKLSDQMSKLEKMIDKLNRGKD